MQLNGIFLGIDRPLAVIETQKNLVIDHASNLSMVHLMPNAYRDPKSNLYEALSRFNVSLTHNNRNTHIDIFMYLYSFYTPKRIPMSEEKSNTNKSMNQKTAYFKHPTRHHIQNDLYIIGENG